MVCGGQADGVLPQGEAGDRVLGGGEQREGAGGGVRGELVQGQRVWGRRVGRVGGREARGGGRGQRGRQRRQAGGAGQHGAGRHAGEVRCGVGLFAGGVGGIAAGQLIEEFPLAPAAQEQQYERLLVDEAGRPVAEGRGVLAGRTGGVRAGAARDELARTGQEPLRQGLRNLSLKQAREGRGVAGQRLQEFAPLGVGEGLRASSVRYGRARLPRTYATIRPGVTVTAWTWPSEAYAPPRARRAGSRDTASSADTQALPHQLAACAPAGTVSKVRRRSSRAVIMRASAGRRGRPARGRSARSAPIRPSRARRRPGPASPPASRRSGPPRCPRR